MDDKKTALQESVERIKSWVTIKYPEQANRLLPGLTDEEIERITRDLPCPLPAELRCLYKSINGFPVDDDYDQNLFIWDRHILLPLQEAMDRWKGKKGHINRLNSSDFFLNPAPEQHCYRSNCFPFLSDWGREGEGYAIIDANDLQTCKVIFTIKRDEIKRRYISLTALVQTLVDWYEQENLLDTGMVGANNPIEEKYYHTWKKYNTYTDLTDPFDFLYELYEW
jgi:SMI1 / KNR4 family (SUKH-1)